MEKLILIDANSLIFKAYYATAYQGSIMKAPNGVATNALNGVIHMTLNLIKKRKPTHIVFAFDKGEKTFRHNQYAEYKAGRRKAPHELKEQFPLVKKWLDIYNIKWLEARGYEADDIIATFARANDFKDYQIEIFSSDRDLLQLVTKNSKLFFTTKGVSNLLEINDENFVANYHITPEQIPDLKGLMGDSSDNLKGVPGIGPKTATKYLLKYHNLENLFAHVNEITGKNHQTLKDFEKQALMCKEVATLYPQVPLTIKPNDYLFNPSQVKSEDLQKFLQEFALNKVMKLMKLNPQSAFDLPVTIVKDLPLDFKPKAVALHCEIMGENYNIEKILGMGISDQKNHFFISKDYLVTAKNLWRLLKQKNIKKIAFDSKQLVNSCFFFHPEMKINNIVFDIKIAAHLLNHQIASSILKIAQYFSKNYDLIDDQEIYGGGKKKTIPSDQILSKHVLSKCHWIWQSKSLFEDKLKVEKLTKTYYDIEFPLINVLAQMEQNGVLIDQKKLQEIKKRTREKISFLKQEIQRIAGVKFNVDSPSQLGKILFEDLKIKGGKKTKTKAYSTSFDVLSSLINSHEIIKYILLYRKYAKLLSTYICGVEDYIQDDGKIHSVFNQSLTQTGRISSRFPNLQNISINDEIQKKVRQIFVAPPGFSLLSFDYSQIELRVLAHFANAKVLIEAFTNDEDVHLKTASKIFNKEEKYISLSERKKAKSVNFGIVYGISDFGLARDLKIPLWEAKNIILNHQKTFPEITSFATKTMRFLTSNGYVKTLLERKRYIPGIYSQLHFQRQAAKRMAINTPIQGTAAEILKVAMVKIAHKFNKEKISAKMILQIHDELVFEVKDEQCDLITEIVVKEMEKALLIKVPLKVNTSQGKNLYQLK